MYNTPQKEKGVALIITFLIMTVALAVVLNLSIILFSEVKITGNIGNSTSSLYAAITGAEEVLYFDKKQIPSGASRGFCNICNVCGELTNCNNNCSAVSLSSGGGNGCDLATCNNCGVKYESSIGDRDYEITATITPDPQNPASSILNIQSRGKYKDTARAVELNVFDE